jgi:AcrR family transcriptional regulator
MKAKRASKPRIDTSPRKSPRQSRSLRMKEDLLEAAARVLERLGAEHFTTNHVAEAAGASVGSLYQYFPNKAALLVALHEREADATWQRLAPLLDDAACPPRERFERLICAFFEVQADAAAHHAALNDTHASVTTTPTFLAFERRVVARLQEFLRTIPGTHERDCAFLAQLAFTVATSVGERLTVRRTAKSEARRFGRATACMLADALTGVENVGATLGDIDPVATPP